MIKHTDSFVTFGDETFDNNSFMFNSFPSRAAVVAATFEEVQSQIQLMFLNFIMTVVITKSPRTILRLQPIKSFYYNIKTVALHFISELWV